MSTKVQSIWMATTPETHFEKLRQDIHVDVAIIGGGITGLTAALLLKQAGKQVAVVDMNPIATGETGFTTAHLTEILDMRYHTLISHFGKEGARVAVGSHRAAISRIEQFISAGNISCGFTRLPGYLYTEKQADISEIEREVAAARELGVPADIREDVPLPFKAVAAMRVENQARFHPREYLLPLASMIVGNGSSVHEATRVNHIEDGSPCRVDTDQGRITAEHVIVASNSPISNWICLHTKVASYRTYAVGARLAAPVGLEGLFYDTDDPYHYIRTHSLPQGEFIIVGGEDHKTGTVENTEDCFSRLEAYTRTRFDIAEVPYRWSGQILESIDGLAYIGRNSFSKNVYVATGFSGNGMTYGTIAGMLLSDEILGRKNEWAALYDATRLKPLASIGEFVSENKDFPAYFVGDRLAKADTESVDEVKSGEGKIVSVNGEKLAVYRDDKGAVHALSPVCTHMACLVHWNSAEKTWDCPCHGARYDPDGKVLNGPAITDLKPATLPELHAAEHH